MNLYLVPTFKDHREQDICIPCGRIEEGNWMVYGNYGFTICKTKRCKHIGEDRKLTEHDLVEMCEVAELIKKGDKVYIRKLKK